MNQAVATSPADDENPESPGESWTSWNFWVTWLVLLAFALVAAQGQINKGLGRMQTPGQPAYNLSSAVSLFSTVATQRQVHCAWATWHAFPDETPSAANASAMGDCQDQITRCSQSHPACGDGTAHRLILAYVVFRLLLMVVVVALLWLLWKRGKKGLGAADATDSYDGAVRRLTGKKVILPFAGLWLASGIAELAAVVYLARRSVTSDGLDLAAQVLTWVPLGKAVALASLFILMVLLWLKPWFYKGSIASDDGRQRDLDLQAWRKALWVMRDQILLVAVFAVILLLPALDQVQDVVLTWADGGTALVTAPLTTLAVFAFGLMIWRSAYRRVLKYYDSFSALPTYVLFLVAASLLVLGFFMHRLIGIGVVILVIGILTSVVNGSADGSDDVAGEAQAKKKADERAGLPDSRLRERVLRLARILAAAPLAFLGLAILRATVLPLFVPGLFENSGAVWLCLGGLVLLVFAPVMAWLLHKQDEKENAKNYTGHHHRYIVITGLAVLTWVSVIAHPTTRQWIPVHAGALAMVAVFGILLGVGLNEVQLWAERATPVSGLRVLGFKRTPVMLLLVLWLVTSVALDGHGTHDVRLTGTPVAVPPNTPPPTTTPVDLTAEFTAWTAANCADTGSPDKPAPLIVVGTSGGGIRAAYWTAEILDSLTSRSPTAPEPGCGHPVPASSRLFAASGVSGGSLGLVSYVARLHTAGTPTPTGSTPVPSGSASVARWYANSLGDDYLSPTLTWGLFIDLPNAIIGLPLPDRARVLEESWEHSQPALKNLHLDDLYRKSLPQEQASGSWLPLLFLNGTQEESGCRFATSPIALNVPASPKGTPDHDPQACRSLQGDPQQRKETLSDSTDYICEGQDVRLSTAALLSARFAFVSPSGHLRRCGESGTAAEYTYIVDGGYAERTGGLTALDLLHEIKPLIDKHNAEVAATHTGRVITPLFVQLENGYETVATASPGAQPTEAQVPTNTITEVRGAVEWSTQQALRQAVGSAAYQRLSTVPGPGVQAPLGWVLSPFARTELKDQMDRLQKPAQDSAGPTPWSVVSAAFDGNWPRP